MTSGRRFRWWHWLLGVLLAIVFALQEAVNNVTKLFPT